MGGEPTPTMVPLDLSQLICPEVPWACRTQRCSTPSCFPKGWNHDPSKTLFLLCLVSGEQRGSQKSKQLERGAISGDGFFLVSKPAILGAPTKLHPSLRTHRESFDEEKKKRRAAKTIMGTFAKVGCEKVIQTDLGSGVEAWLGGGEVLG